MSLGRPEYLEDSDIVSSRFQVTFDYYEFLVSVVNFAGMLIKTEKLVFFSLPEKGCLWCLGAIPGARAL